MGFKGLLSRVELPKKQRLIAGMLPLTRAAARAENARVRGRSGAAEATTKRVGRREAGGERPGLIGHREGQVVEESHTRQQRGARAVTGSDPCALPNAGSFCNVML